MRNESKNARNAPRAQESREYRPVRGGPPPSRAGLRAENRRRRRKRALLCFYIFLFVAVVSAAAAVSLTVLFRIETIEVSGVSRYSQEQIVAASGIKKGENLFLARTREGERQISSRLPYIGSVRVRRKFPAGISITVGAATVCGAVPYGKGYAVLGSDFRILELSDKLPQNCPPIKGVSIKNAKAGSAAEFADAAVKNSLSAVTAALRNNSLGSITGMDFTSPSGIRVEYDGRVRINLGLPSDLDYKVRYAKELFDSGKIAAAEKGELNLSTAAENDTAYFDPDASSG